MKLYINRVKICVTIPEDDVSKVRDAICAAGAGVIGNYKFCSMATKCLGTFIPIEGANPHIGSVGDLEFVKEEKLEVVCDTDLVNKIIRVLREVHPYEEPAIDIIPLIDENCF